ncbi:MAG: glycoside hydrolase family 16 protein [Capnocytophaga ochracea]|mgnify:FL=1
MKNATTFSFITMLLCGLTACNKSGGDAPIEDNPMPETPTEWVLDFQDNFDGNALNTDNWAVYDNEYLEKEGKLKPENTRRTYAIEVKDGFLNCLIDRDYKREGMFITGGIAHKKNYKYGKFEFRIRMDEDPHKSSSGLGLTWPESEKWPDDGENDIYETNHEDNAWNTYIHYAVSGKDQQYQQSFRNYSKTDWHIVAMEWAPEYIKIYIDGKLEWTLKDPIAMAKAPHHLCFQTEKDINKPFTKQLKLQVDWVKVYKYVPKK